MSTAITEDEDVLTYLSRTGIKWKFITPLAPWQGGLYERIVGIVKLCYRSAVGRRLLTWDHFSTVITEVEAVVNSRPLTYVYHDFKSGVVLRPIDFLTDMATGRPHLPEAQQPSGGDAAKHLIRHWKYHQKRLDSLWDIWYNEYLLSLRERGYLNHRRNSKTVRNSPTLNEVVLVKDPDLARGSWKLGRVTRIIPSNDEVVRSVELRLPNRCIIQRSVSQLYPLEIGTACDKQTSLQTHQQMHHVCSRQLDAMLTANEHIETLYDGDVFHSFEQSEVEESERRLIRKDCNGEHSKLSVQAQLNISHSLSGMAVHALY